MSAGVAQDGHAALVAEGGPRLRADLDEVEERLLGAVEGFSPVVADPARETLTAGGKRLRPLLVLLAGGRFGASGPLDGALASAAASVELLHAATLVHDDVLDGAALRRGHPTVVARHGRARAVAVGDLLLSRAFAELAAAGRADLVEALSRASTALAQGELLQREDAWDAGVGEERYLARCRGKTGSLFAAACRMGALAGGGVAPGALEEFGMRVGVAFQLLDDVLDVSGPAERTGKGRGTDLLDGTVTLPLVLAREVDPGLRDVDLRSLDAEEAERVCDRIAATGALDRVRERAWAMVARARTDLPEALEAPRRRALELVAEGVVARYA